MSGRVVTDGMGRFDGGLVGSAWCNGQGNVEGEDEGEEGHG